VDKVIVRAISHRRELRKGAKPGLGFSPVVVRAPVAHRLAKRGELYTA
jgi:hypothetical protein